MLAAAKFADAMVEGDDGAYRPSQRPAVTIKMNEPYTAVIKTVELDPQTGRLPETS